MAFRNEFFKFFTGRDGDVSGSPEADLHRSMVAAFGTNRRGGVNTAAAAKSLGVSQRAVNYWLKGTYKPNQEHLKKITTKSRQAATTKRGRQRLTSEIRVQIAKAKTTPHLYVAGEQGPRNGDVSYLRHRITNLWQNLTPDMVEDFIETWEKGGDAAATEWLNTAYSAGYLEDWGFASIESISLQDPRL
ncbi:MAG: helix-turn-helix domain-containing protein [Renibacterium salmoninarum]|jgi:transposase|nr:helix-turn-helix domain-containing protein [Renibacterium salmoninarum]